MIIQNLKESNYMLFGSSDQLAKIENVHIDELILAAKNQNLNEYKSIKNEYIYAKSDIKRYPVRMFFKMGDKLFQSIHQSSSKKKKKKKKKKNNAEYVYSSLFDYSLNDHGEDTSLEDWVKKEQIIAYGTGGMITSKYRMNPLPESDDDLSDSKYTLKLYCQGIELDPLMPMKSCCELFMHADCFLYMIAYLEEE
mmetsp:Transcript_4160/g.6133  ORF Transcript_4160/g.6133 Transcript_4160/m.6133 type:complete len:195 (+) Transcript_4160:443-1027(+)